MHTIRFSILTLFICISISLIGQQKKQFEKFNVTITNLLDGWKEVVYNHWTPTALQTIANNSIPVGKVKPKAKSPPRDRKKNRKTLHKVRKLKRKKLQHKKASKIIEQATF